MKIQELSKHGISESVISLWLESGINELLPIQIKAITYGKVLEGKNVLVSAPTSSGKTLVGEMAAAKYAFKRRRVFYIVPLKSLAEEKYRELNERYADFGIKVVISTRDRREFDRKISKGDFHIAIVVFEKMHSLMVANPHLLEQVGLVIVDEIHMIEDEMRGASLEILITKILVSKNKPQLIGLSAVLKNTKSFAEWLDATCCQDNHRPMELRKGVYYKGDFQYVEHNSLEEGIEVLCKNDDLTSLKKLVTDLVNNNQQCLIFCGTRRETEKIATMVSSNLPEKQNLQIIDELEEIEETESKNFIMNCLQKGVAIHNSNLDPDFRSLIEDNFRNGNIDVVCATTTLAIGLNLPSTNVIINPVRPVIKNKRWQDIPISQSEYENMSGRAGRFGYNCSFGRAILIADSQYDKESLYEHFVNGELGELKPALEHAQLTQHVLGILASHMAENEFEVKEILLNSFTGKMKWANQEDNMKRWIDDAINDCVELGLVSKTHSRIEITKHGAVAATKSIEIQTAGEMIKFLEDNKGIANDLDVFELLFFLTGTKNGRAAYLSMSKKEHESGRYLTLISKKFNSLCENSKNRIVGEIKDIVEDRISYENTAVAKKALILDDWVKGVSSSNIEEKYKCHIGNVYGITSEFAWMVECFCGLAKSSEWSDEVINKLQSLVTQMIHGINTNTIGLAQLRTHGFARGRMEELYKSGIKTINDVAKSNPNEIPNSLGKNTIQRIIKIAKKILNIDEVLNIKSEEELKINDSQVNAKKSEKEVLEWEEEYPFADEAGISYKYDQLVEIDGYPNKKRNRVKIADEEIYLTNTHFEMFLQMAIDVKKSNMGWLDFQSLGGYDKYHQNIRRLRSSFNDIDINPKELIESRGDKTYRLSVPPAKIIIHKKNILKHLPELSNLFPDITP